jgi:hypothetical protein
LAGNIGVPPGTRAVAITNRKYLLDPISTTFHGRDVFAPAAAHLSLDLPLVELGDEIAEIAALPPLRAPSIGEELRGRVIYVDHFGNVITNFRASDLEEGPFCVDIEGRLVDSFRTYADSARLGAIVGSSGFVEVALRNGSAARELGADVGALAVLRSKKRSN